MGFVCATEHKRQERQAGVPEGLVLTGRHYPKGNNGKYIPDNSGRYFPKNVRYVHVAGEQNARAVNAATGQDIASAGKYVPDHSGRYNPGGSGKYEPRSEGQYVRSKNEGQYVRSSEGKYRLRDVRLIQ